MSEVRGGFANWGRDDPSGNQEGDFYFNVINGKWRWFHSGSWQDAPTAGGGAALTPFDFTDALVSVSPGGTSTIRTVTGKGTATVVVKGDGGADVTMKYSADGGADTAIGGATSETLVPVAFSASLAIKATNAGGSPENSSTVSTTGVYQ